MIEVIIDRCVCKSVSGRYSVSCVDVNDTDQVAIYDELGWEWVAPTMAPATAEMFGGNKKLYSTVRYRPSTKLLTDKVSKYLVI